MRYIWAHIAAITNQYDGSLPLAHYLKQYYRQQPRLGSRDRRAISEMVYAWYRCSKGFAGNDLTLQQQVYACLQQCGSLERVPQVLFAGEPLPEATFDIAGIFPFDMPPSVGITREAWLRSMLVQPDVFIRIRKDRRKAEAALRDAGITYSIITDTCMTIPNGTSIEDVLPADSYVVQDASSQATGRFFNAKKGERWLDSCSGAGGKSLLLKDREPGVALTVTDKRDSILHNLKQRFKLYHHTLPEALVMDATNSEQVRQTFGQRRFDHIICDAPCSGSGTWARTPEQLYFFSPALGNQYSNWQQSIGSNVATLLAPGGTLIYITCSVFRQENEDVVQHIAASQELSVEHMELINGTGVKADSMFVGVLRKKIPSGTL